MNPGFKSRDPKDTVGLKVKVSGSIIRIDGGAVAKLISEETDWASVFVIHAAIHREDQRLALFIKLPFQRVKLPVGLSLGIAVKQANAVLGH